MEGIRLSRAFVYIRNFFLSSVNKEFLIFLFFLVLSSAFWLSMTLNETYEREYDVPVMLVNVPKNVVITTNMTDTVQVTIRDKGFLQVAYRYINSINLIKVNFQSYANANTGRGIVPVGELTKQVSQQLYGTSKIVSIKPDKLDFYFNYGLSRKIPVRMSGKVTLAKSYYLARIRFWPDSVTVYANSKLLDSIRYVNTDMLNLVNIEDTLIQEVQLRKIQGAKIVPEMVKIGLYPDILTEESVEVPITAINMPKGKILRTFPSRVKVKFVVGASMFRLIRAEHFKVVADYDELSRRPSDKCNIYLKATPHGATKARLEFNQVDYLIEQQ